LRFLIIVADDLYKKKYIGENLKATEFAKNNTEQILQNSGIKTFRFKSKYDSSSSINFLATKNKNKKDLHLQNQSSMMKKPEVNKNNSQQKKPVASILEINCTEQNHSVNDNHQKPIVIQNHVSNQSIIQNHGESISNTKVVAIFKPEPGVNYVGNPLWILKKSF
jgi:hypothetical protein